MTWWAGAWVKSENWVRLDFGPFDIIGIVAVAYTVFAVAAGVALGALIRKTLPAMVATVGVFAAVRIPIIVLAREHYMAPKIKLTPFSFEGPVILGRSRDWVLNSEVIDSTGGSLGGFFTPEMVAERCPDLIAPGSIPDMVNAGRCLGRLGVQMSETFHPDNRFWSFQAIEAAIFFGLAAALIAFVIWRVKRVS